MDIPDGEYEIDLLVLDNPSDGQGASMAVRYGFIPDSMDTKRSLKLYQGDLVCILEALLLEKAKHTGTLGKIPIIFEGVPQRQRLPLNTSAAADSYFLAFLPAEGNVPMKVHLKRLASTIRFSKSRNAEKWRTAIADWHKTAALLPVPQKVEAPLREAKRETPEAVRLPPKAKAIQVQKPQKARKPRENPAPRKPSSVASKRPPTATPDLKPSTPDLRQDIISVSDFEGLDSDDGKTEGEARSRQYESTKLAKSEPKKAAERAEQTDTKKSRKKLPKAKDDDDFADLEDQLYEVLDESHPPADASSDDSETERFSGGPIVIDFADKPQTRAPRLSSSANNKKPMSLRELYGGSKTDDMSSSEEE